MLPKSFSLLTRLLLLATSFFPANRRTATSFLPSSPVGLPLPPLPSLAPTTPLGLSQLCPDSSTSTTSPPAPGSSAASLHPGRAISLFLQCTTSSLLSPSARSTSFPSLPSTATWRSFSFEPGAPASPPMCLSPSPQHRLFPTPRSSTPYPPKPPPPCAHLPSDAPPTFRSTAPAFPHCGSKSSAALEPLRLPRYHLSWSAFTLHSKSGHPQFLPRHRQLLPSPTIFLTMPPQLQPGPQSSSSSAASQSHTRHLDSFLLWLGFVATPLLVALPYKPPPLIPPSH